MIINEQINFNEWDPYIKTEETIIKNLIKEKDNISDDYELMPYPLAHWINEMNIPNTQSKIDSLKSDKRRVFICQHIFVHNLNFKEDDIVFTPHSSTQDNFYTIPHYAVNVDKSYIKEERELDFSFLGSTTTHQVRKLLVAMYNNCYDSNVHWGLDKGMDKGFNEKYIELLGKSNFSLCPRGTGISSVRFFESMAMESIPVVISDGYQFPLEDIIDWDSIVIKVGQDNINHISSLISKYMENKDNVESIRSMMVNTYNEYFSNENLHKTVLLTLNDN